jgi:outer membrane protein assembly factor BamE
MIAIRNKIIRTYSMAKVLKTIQFSLFLIFCLSSLNACRYLSFAKIKTQQGNLIKQQELKKIKLGMHKTDVAIILGNSLITSTFQKNRWDYVFTYQKGEGPILVKRASLFFQNDKLVKMIKVPS